MGTGVIIIKWMGTGSIIYQMDGHEINHLSNGWARDESLTKWMGTE